MSKEIFQSIVKCAAKNLTVDAEAVICSAGDSSSLMDYAHAAKNLTGLGNDFKDLDYRFLAARIMLVSMFNEAKSNRGIVGDHLYTQYSDYTDFVKEAVRNNIYSPVILEKYTESELHEIGKLIKTEYDDGFDYAGINLLYSRYLAHKDGKLYELPQEMYLTVAALLACNEKDKMYWVKVFYEAIASRKVSLATPLLMNLRRLNGNLASCFITSVDDSLDDIYYSINQIAQVSKQAGGIGVNISKIRAGGSWVSGSKGSSNGVMPWVKVMNDTLVAVDQQNKRKGAGTIALDVWHLDIEDFLNCRTESGDLRKKAFDIFPQVVIPDLFMERVLSNDSWTLFDPYEIKTKTGKDISGLWGEKFDVFYKELEQREGIELKKSLPAKSLFIKICQTSFETGLPYVFFKDTVNSLNPNKHRGYIGCANLCQESFSNFSSSTVESTQSDSRYSNAFTKLGEMHTCNLVSLNLALLDKEGAKNYAGIGVRILDNAIDLTETPTPESKWHNLKYRIVGVGTMGLADYLAVRKIQYGSENSLKEIDSLYENIAYGSLDSSCLLAEDRGYYPAFKGSEWDRGIFFGRDSCQFDESWIPLFKRIEEFGLRNGGLLAIAPNTSTSPLVGATASFLPAYNKFFLDVNSKGSPPVCPPHMSKETFWFYPENINMDQRKIVNVASTIQKWVDQGISMEFLWNTNLNNNAVDYLNLYVDAWRKKCKTVYYIRSVNLREDKDECISCSG